jgi:hypothetical protein
MQYEVTISLEDGTTRTETVEDPERVPVKGESFEYEHREVRVGQITNVDRLEEDGTVTHLTETSDAHHEIIEPDNGDDVELEEVLDAGEVDDGVDLVDLERNTPDD